MKRREVRKDKEKQRDQREMQLWWERTWYRRLFLNILGAF